jgi:hypothetical protein
MPKKRSLTLVISLLVLLTFSCGLLYGCKSDKAKETSKTEGKKTADVIKLAGGDYGYLTPIFCGKFSKLFGSAVPHFNHLSRRIQLSPAPGTGEAVAGRTGAGR